MQFRLQLLNSKARFQNESAWKRDLANSHQFRAGPSQKCVYQDYRECRDGTDWGSGLSPFRLDLGHKCSDGQ
jgi:hypothetical protein